MAEKNNANIGFENKFGMLPAFCGDIFPLRNIER